jgi:2-oxoglutarate ferredoxin oxidoreductase subunit alpha
MKKKMFLSGSKAMAEGAIYAGCRYYYGTPKILNNEIVRYMANRMPEVNGIFVQSENERSAISMVLGSSIAGARVLTTTTTEGIAAMDEGFSYLCGMQLPCVIGNIMSGRFGLRNFEPTQAGYIQAVRGGAAGNYKFIVLAPHTVQEVYDLTIQAFELADKYRNPVMLLIDSALVQATEGLEIETELLHPDLLSEKPWKLSGAKDRAPVIYKGFHPDNSEIYKNIFAKFKEMESETSAEQFMLEDAEEVVVAFGLIAKIVKGEIIKARQNGRKIGLFRPISLSPFPKEQLREATKNARSIKVIEANTGSMYLDIVNIIDKEKIAVSFLGESESLIGFRNIIREFEREISRV